MSKGSGRRPTDENAYKANWDAIFRPKEAKKDEDCCKNTEKVLDEPKLKS